VAERRGRPGSRLRLSAREFVGHEAGFRFICAGPERKALRLAVDEAFDRPTAILHLNWAISVHSDNLPGLEPLSIQSDMTIVFHGRAATNLPRR
jgi:hypothetical protein